MIKRALTLVAAMHITASVFINDDESGLHHDYEVWLERLAPHVPIDWFWGASFLHKVGPSLYPAKGAQTTLVAGSLSEPELVGR